MDFATGGWADDAPETCLPADFVVDKGGFRIYTSYRVSDGEKQKIERKFKLVRKKKLVSKVAVARRALPKFGDFEGVTTSISNEDIRILSPDERVKEELRAEEQFLSQFNNPMKGRFAVQIEEAEAAILALSGGVGGSAVGDSGDIPGYNIGKSHPDMSTGDKDLAGPSISKYVSPMRGESGHTTGYGGRDDESNTLRVSNISQDTTENDLHDLFKSSGRIQRVYLAKDRETHTSRGFAFVTFFQRPDSEKAIKKLNGYGYDHLILKVEWAQPSNRDSTPDEGTQRTGGYGGGMHMSGPPK